MNAALTREVFARRLRCDRLPFSNDAGAGMARQAQDMTQPPIRSLGDTAPVSFSRTTPDMAKRAALYGDQVALMPHDPAELLQFLHYKLYQSAQIRRRAGLPFGGILNWALGEGEADYIHCAGVHLTQVLDVIGVAAPAGVTRAGQYALSVPWAQLAYDRLRDQMGLPPLAI